MKKTTKPMITHHSLSVLFDVANTVVDVLIEVLIEVLIGTLNVYIRSLPSINRFHNYHFLEVDQQ